MKHMVNSSKVVQKYTKTLRSWSLHGEKEKQKMNFRQGMITHKNDTKQRAITFASNYKQVSTAT